MSYILDLKSILDKSLLSGIDLSEIMEGLSDQLKQMVANYINDIDLSKINNLTTTENIVDMIFKSRGFESESKEIRVLLKRFIKRGLILPDVDFKIYSKHQLWTLLLAAERNIDMYLYMNPEEYDGYQMLEIYYGLLYKVDVAKYTNSSFSANKMRDERLKMMK